MGYHNNRAFLGTAKPAGHQREVDAPQARIRTDPAAGRRELFRPESSPPPQASDDLLDRRIAEELELVVRQLEQLGGTLAADPILLHKHAMQLQSIDLMKQVLGHLARLIGAADRRPALDRVTLTELKARLTRRPIRALGDEAA